jgi:hypothetical protein
MWRHLQPYPDHILNHNTPSGIEPSKICVCKEVFIRHSFLSLPFRTQTGQKADEYQEHEETPFQCKICRKTFTAGDSLNGMREHTLERHTLCVRSIKSSLV